MRFEAMLKSTEATTSPQDKKKAFLRWLSRGTAEHELLGRYLLQKFLPILRDAGFEWIEKETDGGRAQVNSISLERHRSDNYFDYVIILFDKYRYPKFKICSGRKEKEPPFQFILAGDLVRYKSELDRAKWWAPRFWQLNKTNEFKKKVDKVSKFLPQLISFLDDGEVGPNIWKHEFA